MRGISFRIKDRTEGKRLGKVQALDLLVAAAESAWMRQGVTSDKRLAEMSKIRDDG